MQSRRGTDGVVPRPRNGLSLCAGGGGLDMGVMLAEPGFHTRCYVEWEEYPRQVIVAAQRAGYFAPAPIWDDINTFDGRPFRGAIDTVLAGYPCQPFSAAGQRRGEDDERHLWPQVARIIREIDPRWVFLENVAGHVSLGGEAVLRELHDMGWTPAAGLFSAAEIGAPHERLRWFCVAYRRNEGLSCAGGQSQSGGAIIQPGHDSTAQVADAAQRGQRERGDEAQPGRGGHSDGGHVAGTVDDASGFSRPLHAGQGPAGAGTADDRGAGPALDNAAGARRQGPARIRTEADGEGGERLFGDGRAELADAGRPGLQGRERAGSSGERDRAAAHGPVAERGRIPLFPPGPGDTAAWAELLATSRDMAPSAATRDLYTWARSLEADGSEWREATAEPEFRRLLDGMADRSPKLRLLGNGVFPPSAALAWRTLAAAHGLGPLDLATADRAAGDAATGPFWE